MAPITADLVHTVGPPHGPVLWWALAAGAGLGGNMTAIGASANIVVLGIAEANRQRIGFWHFTRFGAPVTLLTAGISALYLWLRYFVW